MFNISGMVKSIIVHTYESLFSYLKYIQIIFRDIRKYNLKPKVRIQIFLWYDISSHLKL